MGKGGPAEKSRQTRPAAVVHWRRCLPSRLSKVATIQGYSREAGSLSEREVSSGETGCSTLSPSVTSRDRTS